MEWTVNNEEWKVRRMVKWIQEQAPGPIVAAYEAGTARRKARPPYAIGKIVFRANAAD